MKEKLTGPLAWLKGCFVAGGAITSLHTNSPINDFDIYPKSAKARDEAVFWAYESGWWCVNVSKRALTFASKEGGPNLQIMLFDTFDTAKKIFDAFDFTVCMGAFDLDTTKFTLHRQFLLHCSQRFLSFNSGTRFPYASAWRVRKYEERGFTIGKMEFQKILMACAAKPITSWDDLRDQVGGVYGEAMEIPEGIEFSQEAALKVISTMKPSGPMEGFPTPEEAVACISDREIPYIIAERDCIFSSGPKIYAKIFEDDDSFTEITRKPFNGREVSMAEVFPGLRFYKKVVRDGDVFRSLYKPDFVYRLGSEVSSGDPFIYAYATISAARGHPEPFGSRGGEKVILELQASDEADVIFDLRQPRLKKCRVMAAHPLDEQRIAA